MPGDDREYLLFDWLRELLYHFDAEHLLFGRFEVHVGRGRPDRPAWGEPLDRGRHELAHEVKAITYHGLRSGADRRRLAGGSDRGHLTEERQSWRKDTYHGPLEQVDECCWRIPKSYKPGMRVDGLIFADERLLEQIKKDQAPEQVANVAFLPGIQHASLAMPDIHWGYGFCIGGVCATDPDEGGVISPGGVGYDINCGVRLVRSNLFYRDVKPHLRTLVEELFRHVPTGVGKSGRYSLQRQGAAPAAGRGVALPRRPRPGDAGRHRVHRGRRPARRRRPRRRQRPRHDARRRAVRHARLGQPLPRSAGRRSRLRRGSGRASWAWKRTWSAS